MPVDSVLIPAAVRADLDAFDVRVHAVRCNGHWAGSTKSTLIQLNWDSDTYPRIAKVIIRAAPFVLWPEHVSRESAPSEADSERRRTTAVRLERLGGCGARSQPRRLGGRGRLERGGYPIGLA